jgi:hypothetical protein
MPPAFVLSLLLVAFSGFAFHALFGRDVRDLLWVLLLALVGFTGGEALARALDSAIWQWGQVHVGYALAGAWLLMAGGRWVRGRGA